MNIHDPIGHIEAESRFTTRDVAAFRAQRHELLDELGLFVATLVNPGAGIDWDAVPPATREAIAPWLDSLEDAGYLQPYIEPGAADPRQQPMAL